MPTLLDLSNELLYRILKAVPRDDLQSLSLTNKLLHALSDKDRKKHLTLKKKYCTLSFGSYWDPTHQSQNFKSHEDTKDAFCFLESIMKDSEVKEYPQRMFLGSCIDGDVSFFAWHFGHSVDSLYAGRLQSITQHSARLKTMIGDCDFIPEEDKEKASVDILSPKHEGLAVSLVTTMLPNLRSIHTQNWSFGVASKRLCATVVKIAEANQDPMSPNHNKALSVLQEVSLSHTDDSDGERISSYVPFAMLPSMRILRGIYIAGETSFEWPSSFQPGSSNVTEIDFTLSAVDASAFESLLSGISALRRFTYHHYGPAAGFAVYNATGYVHSLRRHAASSLQLMNISKKDTGRLFEEEEDQQRVGSLQMFTSLENVRLECAAFSIAGPNEGLNGDALEERGFYTEEEEETTESMERLVDFLPASIKCLTIINCRKTVEVQQALRGMAEEVSEKLPAFKEVTFEGNDPLDYWTKEALKQSGLTLQRWTRDCESSPIKL